MFVLIITMIGLALIIIGYFALRYSKRVCESGDRHARLAKFRTGASILGLMLAIGSFVCVYLFSYTYGEAEEAVRVVGVPFIVAFFDSDGRDYVGPLSTIASIGNAIFWYLAPHLLFSFFVWLRSKNEG